jgi:hypothetical protein
VKPLAAAALTLATLAALTGCGKTAQTVPALRVGRYDGVDARGQVVDVRVDGSQVKLDSRQTWLPDPTTTGTFLVRTGSGFQEWRCSATEQGRSLHCDVWQQPSSMADPTPNAIPCITPGANAPAWCSAKTHQQIDLLRICTDSGCA